MTMNSRTWNALLQISLSLGQSLKTDVVLERILDGLSLLIPNDVCTILLKEDRFLQVAAQRGFKHSLHELDLKFEIERHPRLDRAFRAKQPILFENHEEPDPFDDLIEGAEVLTGKIHSCMAAPLILNHEPIGLITVDHLEQSRYRDEEKNILWFFGSFAALAIHHSRLVGALEKRRQSLESQNRKLLQNLHGKPHKLIGSSATMSRLRERIQTFAPSSANVLIQGPTGSGKELVAHNLHMQSPRYKSPMIYVNCAAIPDSLAESELFGHSQGAFTGALGERRGKFEEADGSTLFLDEIGELALPLQASLLRTLQEGEVQRIGENRTRKVDVRVIAATNQDLTAMQERKQFRTDLFHRLSILNIPVPSLSERTEDIVELCEHHLQQLKARYQRSFSISPQLLEELKKLEWKGGVRELFHRLESMAVWADGHGEEQLHAEPLDSALSDQPPRTPLVSNPAPAIWPGNLQEATLNFQAQLIQKTLDDSAGNQSQAAKKLGLHPANLLRKMRSLGLK